MLPGEHWELASPGLKQSNKPAAADTCVMLITALVLPACFPTHLNPETRQSAKPGADSSDASGSSATEGGRVTKGGKMPTAADRHSATLLTAGGVAVTVGGVFMAVTALEPSKTPRSIWANAWFATGFGCLAVGVMLALLGLYLHFRRPKPTSPAPEATEPAPVTAAVRLGPPLPPLVVKILPDSRFEGWQQSIMIAILHVEVENTTDKDILIDGYEFTYDTEGRPLWDHQGTNDEQISVLQEINRRDQSQEHGQPLQKFRRIAARNRISGWFLRPVPRSLAGGTPECTVVVRDDIGNRYPAKMPRQEPRTYDPVSG